MKQYDNISFILGATNTGKTYYAIERMLSHSSGIIGLPLRLLAREVYEKIVLKKGKLSTALITGEEQIVPPRAKYFVSTVEAMPTEKIVDFIAVDEIQLCNDYERGHVFTERLLYSRGTLETLFLGSTTMEHIVNKIFPKATIMKKLRRSNLSYIGKKSLLSLPKRSAIIAFKTTDVYNIASKIKATKGGAAVVLGALSPQTRNSQVAMFEDGAVDYIIATDAIGMGLNLNIKNVSLSALNKYDGKKVRALQNTELAQIAGRAGRDSIDGFFSSTLSAPNLTKDVVESIEKNIFEPINFLYWRNRKLDFTSLDLLIKSLDKKSENALLIKTLNIRDENILKYLASLTKIQKYLTHYDNIKLLWEVSTIPDYMKSLDYHHTDILMNLFINLVKNGVIDIEWAKKETKNLIDIEGSIDVLTYRLAKTRFWNYVANRNHWFTNNSELKGLAKEAENIISKALHEKLTDEFVDRKLKVLVEEINFEKKLLITISEKREIILNEKIIGYINGLEVRYINKSSIEKNKIVYQKIINETIKVINSYISTILKDTNFNLKITNDLEVFYKGNKLASIYKSNNILHPNIIISNNQSIDPKLYKALEKKINNKLEKILKIAFWDDREILYNADSNLKAILFSLKEQLGIIKIKDVSYFFSNLKHKSLLIFKNNNVNFTNNHIYYKSFLDDDNKKLRWLISNLYLNQKNNLSLPDKNIFKKKFNYNYLALNSIGYIKLKKYVIKLKVLENFYTNYLIEKKSVYLFNQNHMSKYNLQYEALQEILNYFGLKKIVGTQLVSFWNFSANLNLNFSKVYDKDSPFYILKKLQ